MAEQFDLIVIGTGAAASAAALPCRGAGWRVAVVDHLPFGGTCALRGCDPKRVLIGAAEALDRVRRGRGAGLGGGEPAIEWQQLMAFKRRFTDPVPRRREEELTSRGIETLHGLARFRGARLIEAAGRRLEARFILLANGAAPVPLGIPGEEYLATSADFLELDSLPRRLVLVGGGYIAAEFSHLAARAGAHVTVLQCDERLLTRFDPDLVQWLTEKSRALGIDVRLGARVEAVERDGGSFRVRIASHGDRSDVRADLVVHAAGRAPNLAPLDLDAGGVEHRAHRLQLNAFLQSTSNPAVYAAGDAAEEGPPLTPIAARDGALAAWNMLEGNQRTVDYRGVPSTVFTIPPLARVGLLEAQAREQNLQYRVRCERTAAWYTARRVAEDCAGFKVLVDERTERILGAHLVGPQADEVINVFALAVRAGLTASQLKDAVFSYPTACSDVSYML